MYKTKIFKIGVVTMKEKELIDIWKKEESVAHIHGWDFSHIEGRYTEETDLPWNYQHITGLLKTRNETAGYRYWWW